MSVRLGVERPDRPLAIVAAAEARVIQHEFARRLGNVTLDLRVDGNRIGTWQPSAHAAWPGEVDAVVDAHALWREGQAPLTTLFGRTLDPAAVEVRTRMLHHLGVLPATRIDDETVEAWIETGAARPTDLWLVINHADVVDVSDTALAALRQGDSAGDLDAVFDRLVVELMAGPLAEVVPDQLQRALADVEHERCRADESADEVVRVEREAADCLDALRAEIEVLRDQVERGQLAARLDTDSTSTDAA